MLTLEAYSDDPLCEGFTWAIADETRLAGIVAWLILGDHLHSRDVLQGLERSLPHVHAEHLSLRIAEFATPPGTDTARWHRDGWIFQMLSWVAAQVAGPPTILIRAPQPRKADKGLDAFMVMPAHGGVLPYLTIGEDKATGNARHTVTTKVWPEFRSFETHERDNEVVTELGTLLDHLPDAGDRRALIEDVLWRQPWRYRIAITITLEHHGSEGRAVLFDGYDETVAGPLCSRRRAETIVLPALRDWMDGFARQIARELTDLRAVARV